MAKQNTDIKFSAVKKKAKETYTTEQYTLEDGSTITFHPHFPPLLVKQLFEECQSTLGKLDEGLQMSEKDSYNYILFMCIKHFTHFKNQLKADDLVGQINEMNSLIDAGLFDLIIDEIFLQEEIRKVFDQVAKLSGTNLFLENMTQKMFDEVSRLELKNKEVFKNLNIEKEFVQ